MRERETRRLRPAQEQWRHSAAVTVADRDEACGFRSLGSGELSLPRFGGHPEPDAGNPHVRICGSPGGVSPRGDPAVDEALAALGTSRQNASRSAGEKQLEQGLTLAPASCTFDCRASSSKNANVGQRRNTDKYCLALRARVHPDYRPQDPCDAEYS